MEFRSRSTERVRHARQDGEDRMRENGGDCHSESKVEMDNGKARNGKGVLGVMEWAFRRMGRDGSHVQEDEQEVKREGSRRYVRMHDGSVRKKDHVLYDANKDTKKWKTKKITYEQDNCHMSYNK